MDSGTDGRHKDLIKTRSETDSMEQSLKSHTLVSWHVPLIPDVEAADLTVEHITTDSAGVGNYAKIQQYLSEWVLSQWTVLVTGLYLHSCLFQGAGEPCGFHWWTPVSRWSADERLSAGDLLMNACRQVVCWWTPVSRWPACCLLATAASGESHAWGLLTFALSGESPARSWLQGNW